jgi:LuxR family maltose regulon positive regulatory protein
MSTVGLYQPLIARDELVASLDRMTARKVTMISAPVGSGKTSLLRAWAERPDRDRRLALVQVRRTSTTPSLSGLTCSPPSVRPSAQPTVNRQPRRLTSTGGRWSTGC